MPKRLFLGRKKYWMGICPPPQLTPIISEINMAAQSLALSSAIWFYLQEGYISSGRWYAQNGGSFFADTAYSIKFRVARTE
jgi:hypothetical protein